MQTKEQSYVPPAMGGDTSEASLSAVRGATELLELNLSRPLDRAIEYLLYAKLCREAGESLKGCVNLRRARAEINRAEDE